MKKPIYFSLLGIVILAGLVLFIYTGGDKEKEDNADTNGKLDPHQQEAIEAVKGVVEVVADDDGNINANNLVIPWTISKSGGTFYLSQREGIVIEIDGDLGIVEVQGVDVSEEIFHEGQAGFLGFTLAPDFETTNKAFAYHTYQKDGKTLNRIVQLTLQDETWEEEEVLLEDIPGGTINTGGRIQFGPDGMLYATTGDTSKPEKAQELDSLAGKILRMDEHGAIPDDNPIDDSYVYSYGHRNSQGLAWDEQGNLYSSEHGEDGHDEINLIKAGHNYGWPVIEGDEEAKDMESPLYHSGEDTWAPSGMEFDDGVLYIASLAGSKIFTYDIESEEVSEFFDDAGRLRDVFIEDDALFTITSNRDQRGEPREKDDQLIQIPLTEKTSSD